MKSYFLNGLKALGLFLETNACCQKKKPDHCLFQEKRKKKFQLCICYCYIHSTKFHRFQLFNILFRNMSLLLL